MTEQPKHPYLQPTEESGRALYQRGISGRVVMLNLLRYRAVADYSATPQLAPASPITGKEAFRLYIDHTLPHLRKSGGEVIFFGDGGPFLIGPADERWDAVVLVRQSSLAAFIAFASNQEYLAGLGHRTAALEDSRLLPIVEARPILGGTALLTAPAEALVGKPEPPPGSVAES